MRCSRRPRRSCLLEGLRSQMSKCPLRPRPRGRWWNTAPPMLLRLLFMLALSCKGLGRGAQALGGFRSGRNPRLDMAVVALVVQRSLVGPVLARPDHGPRREYGLEGCTTAALLRPNCSWYWTDYCHGGGNVRRPWQGSATRRLLFGCRRSAASAHWGPLFWVWGPTFRDLHQKALIPRVQQQLGQVTFEVGLVAASPATQSFPAQATERRAMSTCPTQQATSSSSVTSFSSTGQTVTRSKRAMAVLPQLPELQPKYQPMMPLAVAFASSDPARILEVAFGPDGTPLNQRHFFISVLEHSVIRLAMLFAWHFRMDELLLLLWLDLTAVARLATANTAETMASEVLSVDHSLVAFDGDEDQQMTAVTPRSASKPHAAHETKILR